MTRNIVELLHRYRAGELAAYVSDEARREQDLRPFSRDEDVDLAQRLLACEPEVDAVESMLQQVNRRRAMSILRKVLHRPSPPMLGQSRLYPCIYRHVDGVTWLLDMVEFAETGFITHVRLWTYWPPEVPMEEWPDWDDPTSYSLNSRPWEGGIDSITDDLGTVYEGGGGITRAFGPKRVKVNGEELICVAEFYEQHWFPGAPPHAQKLILVAADTVTIEEPQVTPPPWPTRDISLGNLTCAIDL